MNPSAIPAAPAQAAPTASPQDFGNYSNWAQQEMAKGFTADQLNQTLAQSNIKVQPTQPAAGQGSGADNSPWWAKILPTAGGILGGIVGIPGDLLTGGAASIAGAGVGAGLGQGVENWIEGKNPIDANVVTSGVENSVGQALGLGAGKIVTKLGEGIIGAGAKAGDKAAVQATEEATKGGAINDATATQLNYGGISPKLATELNLGKNQQFVKSMGFDPTNPYDMEKVSSGVGDLNNVYDRALQNSPAVPMNDFNTTLFKSLKGMDTTNIGNTPIGQAMADFNKSVGLEPGASLPEIMPATQVRQLQQAVGRQIGNTQTVINNAELNGMYNTDAQNSLRTLQDLYQQLGNKIKTPEVNDAISKFEVSGADRQGLVAKYGEQMGNHLADTIGNAKSADDLLGPMQDLTKMGHASKLAINDIENVTNSPRAVARAKFQANGGVVPSSASAAPGGVADVIDAAASAARHPAATIVRAGINLHKAGLTPKIAKGVGNILTRTAPLIPPVAVAASNIPGLAASSAPGSAIPSNQQGEGSAMQPANTAINPVNSVLNNVLNSMQQPGASLTPGYGSMLSTAQALAPQGQQNVMAGNAMAALPSTFANAGGPQGMGGGLLDEVLARVPGTAQNTYRMQQQATAAQLAKVLGISPEQAMAMLPNFMQTPQTAAPQQAANSGIVNTLTAGMPAQ